MNQIKYNLDTSWTVSIILCSGGLRLLLSASNYLITVKRILLNILFIIVETEK